MIAHTQVVNDDLVIDLTNPKGFCVLVSSKSQPGDWYVIGERMVCDCKAFKGEPGKWEGTGNCRHVAAAQWIRDQHERGADLSEKFWKRIAKGS